MKYFINIMLGIVIVFITLNITIIKIFLGGAPEINVAAIPAIKVKDTTRVTTDTKIIVLNYDLYLAAQEFTRVVTAGFLANSNPTDNSRIISYGNPGDSLQIVLSCLKGGIIYARFNFDWDFASLKGGR